MLRHCLRSINRNFRPKIYQKPWILFRAIRPVKCLGASAGTFLGFVLFSAAAKSYEEQDSSETLNLNGNYLKFLFTVEVWGSRGQRPFVKKILDFGQLAVGRFTFS